GAEVTVLSRDPDRARGSLGVAQRSLLTIGWDPLAEPAPASALADRDAVIHLAGETVAQRWSAAARAAIRDSRLQGTSNLVAGLRGLGAARPRALVSGSAIGYYGAHGPAPLD